MKSTQSIKENLAPVRIDALHNQQQRNASRLASKGGMMIRSLMLAAILGQASLAEAYCNPDYNECPEPDYDEVPLCTSTGTINPKYMITSIVYSVPGTTLTGYKNSVGYSEDRSVGETTTIQKTFTGTTSTTLSASAGLGDYKADASTTFDSYNSSSSKAYTEFRQDEGWDIWLDNNTTEGVNHDKDLFYVWVNPQVTVRYTYECSSKKITAAAYTYTVNGNGGNPIHQYASVLDLKNRINKGTAIPLDAFGLSMDDYKTILAQNPFSYGSTTVDANRFQRLKLASIPYQPYIAGNDMAGFSQSVSNTTQKDSSANYDSSYSVSYSANGSATFLGFINVSASSKGKFTWTYQTAHTSSQSFTHSGKVDVYPPSSSYKGTTYINVYYDRYYGTFMFEIPASSGRLSASGKVTDEFGDPIVFEEVTLRVHGLEYLTYSDQYGRYSFYDLPRGLAEVEIGDEMDQIQLGEAPSELDFSLIEW